MKILITTDLYVPQINGVVTSVLNLKQGLEELGHEVRVLTLSPTVHSYIESDVYYIGSVNSSIIYPGTRIRLKLPKRMFHEIVDWKPDVVHSQCELSTFGYAKKISNICNAMFVHTYHTLYEYYIGYIFHFKKIGNAFVSTLSRKKLNKTDRVIAPSEKAKSILARYGISPPVMVVPSGIDYEKFAHKPTQRWITKKKEEFGIRKDCLCLLYVGRLAKEKNITELLDMIALCKEKPVKLLIVGDGPSRIELERTCKKRHISEKVVFTGMVDPEDIWKYYHLGDVFVNASVSETQGLTTVEAMAAGLPMLCRKDDGYVNFIRNGVNGWQYQDSSEFQNRLEELIVNKPLREKMAENSADEAKQFSVAKFVNNLIKFYV